MSPGANFSPSITRSVLSHYRCFSGSGRAGWLTGATSPFCFLFQPQATFPCELWVAPRAGDAVAALSPCQVSLLPPPGGLVALRHAHTSLATPLLLASPPAPRCSPAAPVPAAPGRLSEGRKTSQDHAGPGAAAEFGEVIGFGPSVTSTNKGKHNCSRSPSGCSGK